MIAGLGRVLRSLFGRGRFEREMSEELRFHLESQAARLESQGLSPEAALGRARAQFGSIEGTKEAARESTGLRLWDELRGDVRYAMRGLRRSPAYAAVAVVTLALGIGANTMIFSVIDGVLLRPLPFPESERLVRIAVYPNGAFPMYRQSPSYSVVAAYSYQSELNLLSEGLPERVQGRLASAGLFAALGVEPQEGRTFREGEDQVGAAPVAIVSDGLWRRRYGADPGVVGRLVSVDGISHEIIGVLPRDFSFPTTGTDLWVPITYTFDRPIQLWNNSSTFIGRLKPGVPLARADAEHRALIPQVREGFPWPMPRTFGSEDENHVRPLVEVMTEGVRARLLLLLGAVSLVLLIACANVANLNLTRMAGREREVAVRQALGASRGRIARQVLTEQIVLSGAGSVLGMGLALLGTPLLVRWLPEGTPRLDQVAVDGRVLGFTMAVTVLAAVLAAVAPLLRVPDASAAEARPRDLARGASRGPARSRLSNALVITEVAVAVALVIGAGLLIRSFGSLTAVDPGMTVDRLVSARITLDPLRCQTAEGCLGFYRVLDERLASMPGVQAHTYSSRLPLEERGFDMPVDIEDHPRPPSEPAHLLARHAVGPEYFGLLGLVLEEGRLLTPTDRQGSPLVAVVSRRLAERYWPSRSPVGKQFKPVWWPATDWITIVGVVADVRHQGPWEAPGLEYYAPLAQGPLEAMYVLTETSLSVPVFEAGFRALVRSLDPTVPVSRVRAMPEVAAASVAAPRVTAVLLGGFALLALVLGAVGVYGVLSYGVTQRRREIGIRMAIGAEPGAVRMMVLRRAGALIAGGLVLGLGAAWLGASAMRGFVYGVSTRDPLTYAAAVGLFGVVGLAAAYLPARRATRVEVLGVLKEE